MADRSVTFNGSYNSADTYGLILDNVVIGKAEPQLSLIEVPFRNGSLDVTDEFGEAPKFKDRIITFDLIIPWYSSANHFDVYSAFSERHNGRRQSVQFSYDLSGYYEGRISVGDLSMKDDQWGFSVEVLAEPFKYQNTTVSYSWSSGSRSISVNITGPSVIPTIYVSRATTIAINGGSYSMSSGTHSAPFSLNNGSNTLTITTTGSTMFTMSYKQGSL